MILHHPSPINKIPSGVKANFKTASKAALLVLLMFLFIYITGCGGNTITNEHTLQYIKIMPQTAEVRAGGKLNFAAVGIDQNGDELIISPVWECHEGKIDSAGIYLAPSSKTLDRISAFVGAKSGTSLISVTASSEASTIEIIPQLKYIAAGTTQQFQAQGRNSSGEIVPVAVTWECKAGKITQSGLYTAPIRAVENEAVSVKTLSVTSVMPFAINAAPPYKIFISPKTTSIKVSSGIKFDFYAYDIYGNAVTIFPTYSAKKGRIDNNGYYTSPAAAGTDEVQVIYNFIKDTTSIEILP